MPKNKKQPHQKPAKIRKLGHKLRHSEHRNTKQAKHLKIIVIVAGLCTILLGGLLGFLIAQPQKSAVSPEALEKLQDLLQDSGLVAQQKTVTSSLGFSISFDSSTFYSGGQVTSPSSTAEYVSGESYEEDELDTVREYSLVKLRLRDEDKSIVKIMQPELTILTNIRKDYLTSREALPENQGLSKLEIWVNEANKTQAKNGMSPISTQDLTIGDITYKRIRYAKTDNSYGITTTYQEDYFLTVQNDRPYRISIANVSESEISSLKLFESVVRTVRFHAPDTTKLSGVNKPTISLASTQLPQGTANIPNTLDSSTLLDVIAKNQPSVVRIGYSHCLNVDLMLPNGSVGTNLPAACNGAIGSGSIVSGDGYIATNGHVTRMTTKTAISGYLSMVETTQELTDRVNILFSYLISAGIVTRAQANELLSAASRNDPTAISKLNEIGNIIPNQYIKVKSEQATYAVQISDEPMRLDYKTAKFNTSSGNNSIVSATFVASDYNPEVPLENSEASDVAILKMEGKFPLTRLGSINGLQVGATMTALGYPAFVDGGLQTSRAATFPSITQGKLEQMFDDFDGRGRHKLLSTNVPIAQGNSGGPLLDTSGNQIGLNTYSSIECPDMNCFGNGMARDVADYKALLEKNGIKLNTNSEITTTWVAGIEAYKKGDYKKASDEFSKSAQVYPANYLAPKFAELSATNINIQGVPSDKPDPGSTNDSTDSSTEDSTNEASGIFSIASQSSRDRLVKIVAASLSIAIIGGLVAGIILIRHLLVGKRSLKHAVQPSSPASMPATNAYTTAIVPTQVKAGPVPAVPAPTVQSPPQQATPPTPAPTPAQQPPATGNTHKYPWR